LADNRERELFLQRIVRQRRWLWLSTHQQVTAMWMILTCCQVRGGLARRYSIAGDGDRE
jgi:hypothetical protein